MGAFCLSRTSLAVATALASLSALADTTPQVTATYPGRASDTLWTVEQNGSSQQLQPGQSLTLSNNVQGISIVTPSSASAGGEFDLAALTGPNAPSSLSLTINASSLTSPVSGLSYFITSHDLSQYPNNSYRTINPQIGLSVTVPNATVLGSGLS